MESDSVHVSVMPREVQRFLKLEEGLTVLDGTVGAGGHSQKILNSIGSSGRLIGIDRDPMMIRHAAQRLSGNNVSLFHNSYINAAQILKDLGIASVDRVLLDLGLSSDQLSDRERGFGFDSGGPLDMRFDTSNGQSAAEFLQQSSAGELSAVFSEFGEEPFADRIAQRIVEQRSHDPIRTARQLETVVRECVRTSGKGSRNPATRVFQALRIAVNEELDHVQKMMTGVLPEILAPEGIVVVLTFHSLEDRIVKSAFKGSQGWQILTKKPVVSTPDEIRLNPRSRSAKLRAACRSRS